MKSLIPHDWDDYTDDERRDYTWLVQQQATGKIVPPAALRQMTQRVQNAMVCMCTQIVEDETGDKNE